MVHHTLWLHCVAMLLRKGCYVGLPPKGMGVQC